MEVKALTVQDLGNPAIRAGVKAIGDAFIAEAKYPASGLDDYFFTFWGFVLKSDVGIFVIAKENEKIVGVMGALFSPDCFSGKPQGAESFWFVSPEHRTGRLALRLFNFFEGECERRKCELMVMIHLAGFNESLGKFYARRGYTPAEQVFRKVI